ncbi:MAG: bifunctional hydroxymethylpyrimidine kinase/phosphomethylpyrimidine kinase, partial [Bryobacteraceae bacterium]|nr:bifunctional hydroxymethylpyrimidine kinase/phosphomethylpyrimidine kinase [Bryobacteraceae bacterium]
MTAIALTIAGSDPSGGAGLQADLKTFHQLGVYGEAAVTLITVQNTLGVARVECLPADLVVEQICAVLEDIRPQAAKTGALGNRAIVEAVAEAAREFDFPLVVDPVLISKHGAPLLADDARAALVEHLLPRAALVTPNLHEAAALAAFPVRDVAAMRRAAEAIQRLGPRAVLVKGGHLESGATDVLLYDGKFYEFPAPRIATQHTHGTGCTYSAAIAACLARGLELPAAVRVAKAYVTEAIRSNPGLGRGAGPVNHHAPVLLGQ